MKNTKEKEILELKLQLLKEKEELSLAKQRVEKMEEELNYKLHRQFHLEQALRQELGRENKYHPLLFDDHNKDVNIAHDSINYFLNYRLAAPYFRWDDNVCPGLLTINVITKKPDEEPKVMGLAFSAAAINQDLNITTDQVIKYLSDEIAFELWNYFIKTNGKEKITLTPSCYNSLSPQLRKKLEKLFFKS